MLNSRVAVLGAGMVVVATALELQRLGAQITLIDRRNPGQETPPAIPASLPAAR